MIYVFESHFKNILNSIPFLIEEYLTIHYKYVSYIDFVNAEEQNLNSKRSLSLV